MCAWYPKQFFFNLSLPSPLSRLSLESETSLSIRFFELGGGGATLLPQAPYLFPYLFLSYPYLIFLSAFFLHPPSLLIISPLIIHKMIDGGNEVVDDGVMGVSLWALGVLYQSSEQRRGPFWYGLCFL